MKSSYRKCIFIELNQNITSKDLAKKSKVTQNYEHQIQETYRDRGRGCCLVRTGLRLVSALHAQTCTKHSWARRQCSEEGPTSVVLVPVCRQTGRPSLEIHSLLLPSQPVHSSAVPSACTHSRRMWISAQSWHRPADWEVRVERSLASPVNIVPLSSLTAYFNWYKIKLFP